MRLREPVTYEVVANYSAPEGAGGQFTVSFGSQVLTNTVKNGVDQTLSLGRITLVPGDLTVQVAATQVAGDELFRLRNLQLKPVPAVP